MPRVKHAPRTSVSDRPSGWWLLLRRQRRLLRPLGWVVLAGAVGTASILVLHAAGLRAGSGGSLATTRDRFGVATAAAGLRVSNIVIDGRVNTPEPVLRAAMGVNLGDPVFGVPLEATRANIEKIRWVKYATIERRLPGTLIVKLQERQPFAIWQNQGKFFVVDRAGQVVASQDIAPFRQLPLIVGPGAPDAAAELLDALHDRPALADKVSASVRVGERRWNLRITNGSDVMLPEGHEVAALNRLAELQQEQAVLDRPLSAIDMRLPDRLVFRPRPQAADTDPVPPVPPSSTPPTVPVVAKKPN